MQPDVSITHNLETTPLLIKTNSAAGSGSSVYVAVVFNEDSKESVFFNFASPPQYFIRWACINVNKPFPIALPTEVHKVWKITKLPGPKIRIHCNGKLVLDFTISDSCQDRAHWTSNNANVKTIKFYKTDKASDYYYKPAGIKYAKTLSAIKLLPYSSSLCMNKYDNKCLEIKAK